MSRHHGDALPYGRRELLAAVADKIRCRPTIYRLNAAGVLQARKVARRTLIPESALEGLGQPITADRPGAA